jgi:hypothetical protein
MQSLSKQFRICLAIALIALGSGATLGAVWGELDQFPTNRLRAPAAPSDVWTVMYLSTGALGLCTIVSGLLILEGATAAGPARHPPWHPSREPSLALRPGRNRPRRPPDPERWTRWRNPRLASIHAAMAQSPPHSV